MTTELDSINKKILTLEAGREFSSSFLIYRKMKIEEKIVNKVAKSGLITIDLQNFAPKKEIVIYDIKENLFHGLILKEKDFRSFVKEHDWAQYRDKHIGITCSADAIVPTWAYMLLTTKFADYAASIHFGTREEVEENLYLEAIRQIDFSQYQDKRMVIKGCSDKPLPEAAFVSFTKKLHGVAKSIMYGEPCSTVPVYKHRS